MLVAAALVPDTVLLVPGASGRTDVLGDLRGHALAAVRAVLARAPRSVVVVAPGARVLASEPVRHTAGPVRASLAAAGVPDRWLLRGGEPEASARTDGAVPHGAVPHGVETGGADAGGVDAGGAHSGGAGSHGVDLGRAGGSVVGPSASVGLLLLAAAGWRGDVRVVETASAASVAETDVRARLAATGRDLAADAAAHDPDARSATGVALVVVGSLSARHGPDAPRADDERAPAYDAAVLADLADAGPAARARLAALDPALAHELDVTGWGPWQVLLGAAGDTPLHADVLRADAPLGAQHVVATWTVRA